MKKRTQKKRALKKDFRMEVKKSLNRFLSIFFIVAMGVAFYSGIQSSAPDMRYTGDDYFDSTNLMDIRVIGTLGMTEDDVEALLELDGIELAEPGYMTDVLCGEAEDQKVLHVESLMETVNLPVVTEGELPVKSGECFLDKDYADSMGYQVGDTIRIIQEDTDESEKDAAAESETDMDEAEENITEAMSESGSEEKATETLSEEINAERVAVDSVDGKSEEVITEEEASSEDETVEKEEVSSEDETEEETGDSDGKLLKTEEYTVAGIGYSSAYLSYNRGSSTLGNGEVAGFMYVLPEDFDSEAYTVVYLTVAGAKDEITYTDGYDDLVDKVLDEVESIEDVRCEVRYQEVIEEAESELEKYQQEIEDGTKELEDARQELEDGKAEAESELEDARKELESGESELESGKQELESSAKELEDAKTQISEGEQEIQDQEAQLNDGWAQLGAGETQLSSAKSQLQQQQSQYDATAPSARQELEAGQAKLDAAKETLTAGQAEYDTKSSELEAAAQASSEAAAELAASKEAYTAGTAALAEGEQQYAAGKAALDASQAEYDAKMAEFTPQKEAYDAAAAGLAGLQSQRDAAAALAQQNSDEAARMTQENTDAQATIEGDKTRISELQTTITSLQGTIDTLQAEINSLSGEISAAQGEITTKQSELDGLDASLEENAARIQQLQGEIAALQETVNTNQAQLDAKQGEKSTKEAELSQAAADKGALESEIATLTDLIAANTAAIPTANQTAAEQEAIVAALEPQITQASAALEAQRPAIEAAESQLAAWKQELDTNAATLAATRTQLDEKSAELSAAGAAITAGEQQLAASQTQIEAGRGQLAASGEELAAGWQELEANQKKIDEGLKELESGAAALSQGWAQINSSASQLASSRLQLSDGASQLAAGKQTLEDSKAELEEGEQKLSEAQAEIEENEQKLEDGWKEYEEGKADAEEEIKDGEEKILEAEQELADAQKKVDDARETLEDLEEPQWYINDRNVLPEYSGYGENAQRMTNIGAVFPVLFFLVAALISLTTMTRMVEEERTQIGTMKALGYSKINIASKYMKYALYATLGGSVFGFLIGEKLLPYIIIYAYGMMYHHLPRIVIPYNWQFGIVAAGAALVCTLGATFSACYKELASSPAVLMRPPAPKEGKRVLLEYLPFLWKRLSFTWKSTVRNLLRYKKRFFMTVIGIGGCMGLLLVGFGLNDSIMGIADLQYDELQRYDAMVVLNTDSSDEEQQELKDYLAGEEEVERMKTIYAQRITTVSGKKEYTPYLYVPENNEELENFMILRDRNTHEEFPLTDEGVVITEKLATMMGLSVGDSLTINDSDKGNLEVPITAIVENYLYHYVYMTPAVYEQVYGEPVEYNSILVDAGAKYEDDLEDLGRGILSMEGALNVTYTDTIFDQMKDMLSSLNIVIAVLIISAGMLAFVVLYNLNNININERKRELATIKVLGFYDREVSAYVYRENILLTVIGAAAGVLFGILLHRYIITTVEVDACMFGRNINFISFVYGTLFTFGFSAFVNWVMYFKLKKIDMVESLKSVE